MKLEVLHIYNVTWAHDGAQPGDYKGTVRFKGQTGEIQLKLPARFNQRILEIVAEELVAESRNLAQNLTAACIEAERTPKLEDLQQEQS